MASTTQGSGSNQAPKVPTTAAELEALRVQRAMLRDQLESASEMRGRLMQERLNASATNNREVVAELDGRIKEYGDRVLRIERQLLASEDAIATAVANGVGVQSGVHVTIPPIEIPNIPDLPQLAMPPRRTGMTPETVGALMVGEGLLFALLGVILWRVAFRRGERSVRVQSGEGHVRELQQSIDAIAVEVERISENQRFVTKQLSQQGQPVDARPGKG